MADKAQLSKEYADKGWQLVHAQPAQTANDSPTGAAVPGDFIALKRDPVSAGDAPIEVGAQSLEQIESMIADWEQSRPAADGSQPQPTEEQIRNSAEATLHQSITSGARPAVDVDLTPAAEVRKPKAIRLAVQPPINEVEIDEETQAGIANLPPAASKTTGVGEGTTPGAASAGASRKSGSASRKSGSSSKPRSKK